MPKNLYATFIILRNEVDKSFKMYDSLEIQNESEFMQDQNNIAFSVAIVNKLAEISSELDIEVINLVSEISDIIIPLIEYNKNLISKYGTLNTFKLYDFMSLDLKKLRDLLNSLLDE